MTILNYLRLLFLLFDGKSVRGIRCRMWFAIIVSLLAIIADTSYVYSVYDYIPHYIPAIRDWDSHFYELTYKSAFFEYELQRIFVLTVMLLVGYAITLKNPGSIIAKRTQCFLAETAMLIITTGVGISIVELSISLGDKSEELSDYWEWTIMLFWFAITLSEYIYDFIKLKKNHVKKEETTTNT